MSLIQGLDDSILFFIRNNMHNQVLDKGMVIITFLGDSGLIWIIIALILILNKKYRTVGLMVLAALLLSTMLGDGLLKPLFHRLRPSTNLQPSELLIKKPMSYSFPSGHTTSSFAAAGVLSKYLRKYGLGFFVLAVLIAFSRMYLFVHYPTDILGGIILGLICSIIIIFIFTIIEGNRVKKLNS